MPASKYVKLNTGANMPTVGLGTWKSPPGTVEHAVEFALRHGYRHIDTAAFYGNEGEVGMGIKASGAPRSEVFLTTKLDNYSHKNALQALENSLKNLGTDYLDLWLMHFPAPMANGRADKTVDWLDTWKAMEKLYKSHPNKLRAIGVSNVSVQFMERLLNDPEVTVLPAINQVELHPSCPQQDIVDFCNKKGIAITAYSPLGSDNSPLLANKLVRKIADDHNVQPANVLISLQANRPNVTVLAKSVTNARIANNFNTIDLDEEEIKQLNDIDKTHHFRAVQFGWTGWGALGFPDCQ